MVDKIIYTTTQCLNKKRCYYPQKKSLASAAMPLETLTTLPISRIS